MYSPDETMIAIPAQVSGFGKSSKIR